MGRPTRDTSFSSHATLSGYDLWSQNYDAFDNPMIAMAEWALDQISLEIKGKRVIEIGCGTGRNVPRFLREGAKSYVGIDGSSGMLEQARRRFENIGQVSWIESDILREFPLSSSTCDLVVITLVLEHVPFLGALFSEISRILQSDGQMRIIEIHPELIERGTQAHFWHEGKERKLESFPHDADEYRAALANTGLNIQSITEWYAPAKLIHKLPKLGKHAGHPMVIDIAARK